MDDTMRAFKEAVELFAPLDKEERVRVLRALAAFFDETPSGPKAPAEQVSIGELDGLSARARVWMKQNSLTAEQLQQVFHLSSDGVEVIAPQMPGKSKREQTYNAYVVAGIGNLLLTGVAAFDDKEARALCERSGCYDSANHSAHLRHRGNEFTGSKEKGWTLTAPGLKRAAEIIKEMQAAS